MATKYLALAEVALAQGQAGPALDALRRALALGSDDTVTVPAARLFLRAGNEAEPKRIAAALLNSLQPESRAYGHFVTGEIALKNRRTTDAVESFRSALKLTDLWLARFMLGVAYVEAGGHDAEALSELDACLKPSGEATAIFLDDAPSYRYLAALPYWLGPGAGGCRPDAQRRRQLQAVPRPQAGRGARPTGRRCPATARLHSVGPALDTGKALRRPQWPSPAGTRLR